MKNTSRKPGALNLPRLFQAEALSLLEAVERGLLLHRTKNIRDSGGPLETRLRNLLGVRMPQGFEIAHGYLFDIESNCTPQIDAMLLSMADNHTVMTTDDGAIYAPFTSALAVIEIKSSVGDVEMQLQQTRDIVERIEKMQSDLRGRRHAGGASLPNIVSVLFYATSKSGKVADFKNWYTRNPNAMPTYTVFLDRACVITAQHVVHDLLAYENPPPIDFNDHRNGAGMHMCVPDPNDDLRCGRVLLWMYFALLNSANQFAGNQRPVSDFVMDAARRFPIHASTSLAACSALPDLHKA